MTTIMVRDAAAEDLVLCRSDAGCGGWSLHYGDKLLLSGPSEADEWGDWMRPNEADNEEALRRLRTGQKRKAYYVEGRETGFLGTNAGMETAGELESLYGVDDPAAIVGGRLLVYGRAEAEEAARHLMDGYGAPSLERGQVYRIHFAVYAEDGRLIAEHIRHEVGDGC